MIPKSGKWIIIIKPIPVEIPIDLFSIWFAKPSGTIFIKGELEFGEENECRSMEFMNSMSRCGFHHYDSFKQAVYNRLKNPNDPEMKNSELDDFIRYKSLTLDSFDQQVKIFTPFGEVCIQPHEYNIKESIVEFLEPVKDGHAFIRYLTASRQLKGKIAEQVFYLRSRGIGYADAVMMVSENVNSQHLFYIEMHPEYQKYFTRDFELTWQRKVRYCIDKNRLDLLNYGEHWNYSDPVKARELI